MLYGCGCGFVDNPNCLMTSAKIRFFWLPLWTLKSSKVPFTYICEWKMCSSSSRSIGSSSWITTVATITMGSVSMIYLLSLFYESNSESGFGSLYLILATNYFFEWHSSVLCQGILWKSHHFPVSFVFLWPFFSCALEWFSEDVC
jgi:hypothetical protein